MYKIFFLYSSLFQIFCTVETPYIIIFWTAWRCLKATWHWLNHSWTYIGTYFLEYRAAKMGMAFSACTLFHEMALYDYCRYTVQPCKPITGPKDSHVGWQYHYRSPSCVTVGNCDHLLVSSTHKPVQMLESVWKMTYQTILCFPFWSRLGSETGYEIL